jgi:hypothetical protein
MPEITSDDAFRNHLKSVYDVSDDVVERLFDEIVGHFDLTIEDYVQKRHLELQAGGAGNENAYLRIQRELETRRFKAPSLSTRQIRRIIYG